MIMFFGFPFSFGFFHFSFGFFRDFAGNNLLPMILSASAFNSCMIEFSISDYNETIIKNIFKHWTCSVRNGSSVSTAVNKRGEGTVVALRAYLCRCTSFPFYDGLLWLHSTDDRKGDGFFLFQTITGAQVFFLFFYFHNAFHCRPGHESHPFQCQSRIKIFNITNEIFCNNPSSGDNHDLTH